MSNAIARADAAPPTLAKRIEFPAPDKAMIRATLATGIKDDKMFALFISTCEHWGLDPRKKQIYGYQEGARLVTIVGIDGWLKLAADTGLYESHEVEFALEGDQAWRDFVPSGHKAHACRVTVWKRGVPRPIRKVCYMGEFYMPSNPNWKSRPNHMLEIRTLAHALRLAFQDTYKQMPADVEFGDAQDIDLAARIVEERPAAIAAPEPAPEPIVEATPEPQPEPTRAAATNRVTRPPHPQGVHPRTRAFNAYRKFGGDLGDKALFAVHLTQILGEDIAAPEHVGEGEWSQVADLLEQHGCLPGTDGWPLEAEITEPQGSLL